ncbi:MGAT1 [Bugula neritina]|uniref:Alpha-1,3-mannosyl-glycoprotein 2-beta-N-acetylglucosaminyltransferase n=1 Tax=Bugula neritina TaxID=10212 RepID=A0A7J7KEF7_BUGNE|nr:MGAT1 [Bugula neritina]
MVLALRHLLIYACAAGTLLLAANMIMVSHTQRKAAEKRVANLIDEVNELKQLNDQQVKDRVQIQRSIYSIKDLILASAKKSRTPDNPEVVKKDVVLPILIFSCNRPTYITKALEDLIKYRTSKEKFPIIVTQDCGHEETSNAIQAYARHIYKHIKQPDLSPIPNLTKKDKKQEGYYKIARHYGWALGQVFDEMKYEAVIIVEDDLNVSPDFFEYFEATHALLQEDSTLFCVSAWNDNGEAKHIDESQSELLYRTDFFPGLGWMMLNSLWEELRENYDQVFRNQVNAAPLIALSQFEEIARAKTHPAVRILYKNKNEFKVIAKALDIMNDFKDGVPRTAYMGIISIFFKGIRVFVVPPPEWQAYDKTWS